MNNRFDHLSASARRSLSLARYEAGRRGLASVGSEHLLLAVSRQGDETANQLLLRVELTSERLRQEIEGARGVVGPIAAAADLPLSEECNVLFDLAREEAHRQMLNTSTPACLILGMLRHGSCRAAEVLLRHGLRLDLARREVELLSRQLRPAPEPGTPSLLTDYGRDLTTIASEGGFDPLIGRDRELLRVMHILSRRMKNNPVLVGEAGVGKTAIVEGLAHRIVEGRVPAVLQGKRLIALDLSAIVAGTQYRGQFEERLKGILDELRGSRQHIVFIDEIHTLIGTGAAEGSLDAANIIKPTLSRGEISCIGATTTKEYRRHIERDRALGRRFQSVDIVPATPEQSLDILVGLKERYEQFHGVRFTHSALEAAVHQSVRYITDRPLPDKAIDAMDEAAAWVNLRPLEECGDPRNGPAVISDSRIAESSPTVTRDDVDQVIATATGIPVARVRADESERLRNMDARLCERVVGQDHAIDALCRAIRRSRLGLRNPRRPIGSFFFVGPSGVGKTEVARRLAEFLFDSVDAMIRFDMSEYMERHTVSKLIGSPPGYVGYEEGGQLAERIRRRPYAVVLFDEIEKAHPDIWNLLLQILEDGRLTDSDGNVVNFTNTIVLMTSNIGTRRMLDSGRRMGFAGETTPHGFDAGAEEEVLAEVRNAFSPEFLNRLDEVILFKPLTLAELGAIINLMLDELNELLADIGLSVAVAPEAKQWILDKAGVDPSTGARNLRRTIQRWIQDEISELLIDREDGDLTRIEVTVEAGELSLQPVSAEAASLAGSPTADGKVSKTGEDAAGGA